MKIVSLLSWLQTFLCSLCHRWLQKLLLNLFETFKINTRCKQITKLEAIMHAGKQMHQHANYWFWKMMLVNLAHQSLLNIHQSNCNAYSSHAALLNIDLQWHNGRAASCRVSWKSCVVFLEVEVKAKTIQPFALSDAESTELWWVSLRQTRTQNTCTPIIRPYSEPCSVRHAAAFFIWC